MKRSGFLLIVSVLFKRYINNHSISDNKIMKPIEEVVELMSAGKCNFS